MTDLSELLARVKAATGPDREIDLLLWDYAGHPTGNYWNGKAWTDVPPFTASVDEALALVERILPGWDYSLNAIAADFRSEGEPRFTCDLTGPVTWVTDEGFPEPICDGHSGKGGTQPLAILAALLTALQSTPETQTP